MTYFKPTFSSAGWRVMLIVLALVGLAAAAGAADDEERVVLHAETQLGTADGWHGEGEVHILYQDIEIHCDEVDYDRATGDLVALGNGWAVTQFTTP